MHLTEWTWVALPEYIVCCVCIYIFVICLRDSCHDVSVVIINFTCDCTVDKRSIPDDKHCAWLAWPFRKPELIYCTLNIARYFHIVCGHKIKRNKSFIKFIFPMDDFSHFGFQSFINWKFHLILFLVSKSTKKMDHSRTWSILTITSYNHFCTTENSREYRVWCRHLQDGNHSSRILNSLRARKDSALSKRTDLESVCHIWHKNVVSHPTIPI